MKKSILLLAAAMLVCSCGFQKNSASSTQSSTSGTQQVSALSAGQGAGNAMLNLYNQYKADGNKYDYTNMQNALNTVTLLANCQGLKQNYKDKAYLKEFGEGMMESSLGLVTQDNMERVTNSLVDMVKNNENVQDSSSKMKSGASAAAGYANTAAQYAGAISALLAIFAQ